MKFIPFRNSTIAPQESTKIGTSRLGSFRIGSFRLGSFRETSPRQDSKSDRRSGSTKMGAAGLDSEDESFDSCTSRFISNVEPGEEVTTTKRADPVVSHVLLRYWRSSLLPFLPPILRSLGRILLCMLRMFCEFGSIVTTDHRFCEEKHSQSW